ncbi:hypothetical protein V501_03812 [Pseudogymnoascus sp. VKM F-4519 (FW-2642)]|nr:hypothetical protein V501_03812 [Pseudogymnoascus sp. VKM F-4519 (FW-2642)]
MKFAHEFKEALEREGFPPHWVEAAIPYGQLKKCIKKVERELKSFGLDAQTLGLLVPSSDQKDQNSNDGTPVGFKYRFAGDSDVFRPTLTLYIQRTQGSDIAIDATLSPSTRQYLQNLADSQAKERGQSAAAGQPGDIVESKDAMTNADADSTTPFIDANSDVQQVEVPLTFDIEFFGLLKDEVSSLDEIQRAEQRAMTDEIKALGDEIGKLAFPAKNNKTDMGRWRTIFDLYLQAGVFFSTNEFDRGSRDSNVALKQLRWFQEQVTKLNLPKSFKLANSRDALDRFTRINVTLLRNLKFQEINQLAVTKILKKFDKRTSLGAKKAFPPLIQSDLLMTETMAKAVCAGVSNEIIRIVPQLDDYLCPVCFTISYKPVRLKCNHVFCIRCMIEMQNANSKHCPLCRGDVVLEADAFRTGADLVVASVDKNLTVFLKKYFPKETKAKQQENDIAASVEMHYAAAVTPDLALRRWRDVVQYSTAGVEESMGWHITGIFRMGIAIVV